MTLTAAIMMMGNGKGSGNRIRGRGVRCRVGVGTSSNCCSDSAVGKCGKALSRCYDSVSRISSTVHWKKNESSLLIKININAYEHCLSKFSFQS